MFTSDNLAIDHIALHFVGNKINEGELQCSGELLKIDEETEQALIRYFLMPFRSEEFFRFYHDEDLDSNEAYSCITSIFDDPNTMLRQSVNLARHLFNQGNHPNIKEGEFYVVLFSNCVYKGEVLNAVGIFKSENKETFLQVEKGSQGFEIEQRQGINISKLDKGCMVLETSREDGYKVAIIDNTNKGNDTQYWKDNFLMVKPVRDEFHQTNEIMGIARQFVTKQITEDFSEVSKTDQIDLLNRSVNYFKTHEVFSKPEFEESVFPNENVMESFRKFDKSYRQEQNMDIQDSFEISPEAVKKQARVFKSVLKLDKNFHIYIHGDRKLIEQGVEDNGRKYYKIYYNEEN